MILPEPDRDRINHAVNDVRQFWDNDIRPVWMALLANPAHADRTPDELVALAKRHARIFEDERHESITGIRADLTRQAEDRMRRSAA